MKRLPLPIGTKVPFYGRVVAVVFSRGERMYVLKSEDGALARISADIIETLAE